jgi:hypothetical protein
LYGLALPLDGDESTQISQEPRVPKHKSEVRINMSYLKSRQMNATPSSWKLDFLRLAFDHLFSEAAGEIICFVRQTGLAEGGRVHWYLISTQM